MRDFKSTIGEVEDIKKSTIGEVENIRKSTIGQVDDLKDSFKVDLGGKKAEAKEKTGKA